MIEDTSKHPIVRSLQITEDANIGSYLGVPIILDDETMFGTLCAIDPSPYKFSRSDLELLKTLANFIGNAIDLGQAYERILFEEQRVKKELEIAKKVQTSVLSDPICLDNMQINAFYQSSESLSGDMYSWFQISPSKFGIVLLDVMGHGVPAALISMSIRSLLGGLITTITDPIEVIKELNQHIFQLYNSNTQTTYATAIYMVVDTESKLIEYVNAGHPSGLLLIGNADVRRLDEGSLVLGIFPNIQVNKQEVRYTEGVTGLLFTDGLLELISPMIDEGLQTLEDIMESKQDLTAIINEIHSKYIEDKALKDDICLMSIKAH